MVTRWLFILFLCAGLIASFNFFLWNSDDYMPDEVFLSAESTQLHRIYPETTSQFTVEKLNRQTPVKQLRKELLKTNSTLTGSEISPGNFDERLTQLEKQIKKLSN